MDEWSPESRGGRWLGDASSATDGARFLGANRNGWHRWSTVVTVTEARPAAAIEFDVDVGPLQVSTWRYEFNDTGDGTTLVTESWRDRRPAWFVRVAVVVTGVHDRRAFTARSIDETLAALAATAES